MELTFNWKQASNLWLVCLLCFPALCLVRCSPLKSAYLDEVKKGLSEQYPDTLLTEADVKDLPLPIQNYLRYVKALNKPKVRNFRIFFTGQLRQDSASGWMKFSSEQYNFMQNPTRLFFLKAVMKGLPVRGLHSYKGGNAFMDIRLFSLFKVQYQKGPEMGISETVTFFNDMCCLAPATLIDRRITWMEVNGNEVKAKFTCNKITIAAILHFNEKGQLVNFVSEDRYAQMKDNSMKRFRWSTPLQDYKEFNGRMLPTYAEAIYSYPDGDFCYGTFRITGVEYNCKDLQ